MGERGPQPKGQYGGTNERTAVFTTRLRPETRKRLEAAAQVSGRSLSQELEHRLRQAFGQDELDLKLYGTKENAAIVNLIGATIQIVSRTASTRRKYDWLKEQWLFDDVMAAIRHALLWFRPGGDSGLRQITLGSGPIRAGQLMNEIRSADPALPVQAGSPRQHTMARLKEKLGPLVTARNPYDDFREPELPNPRKTSRRLKRKLRKQK
jgi:TraY domain